ncbi:Death-associated protein kinase 1 [Fasciola gigantica]|uniref:Death-associated protein kinase 1 n=1 Tax=Fasciola gigantica TaxID=46835 RepID=A0A504YY91_FASGI|nr:Death-associated protein kinase 1 [Fasciola gigantica]
MNEKPCINEKPIGEVYEVLQKIGDGHFAEVNLCVCRKSKKEFAAKFILKQRFNSSTVGKEIKGYLPADIGREAFILANLKHENIVKLHEVFHCEDAVVLILDLVTGGELFARVAECERLSEEEASNFVEQILLGIQHMHSLGVVHLDLKPENIMIEDLASRKIKIIDFGLARVLNPNETFQDMAGTPEFCAPEIVNFDPITFATDMWAVGVITYILLTGISPFAGDSQIETFQNILDCIVDYSREEIRDATDLAKDFIRRLLIKNPRKRATVSECLQHPWIRPSDDSQQNCRRGSVIKKANLDGLRHFIAVPSANEANSVSPPLTPVKISTEMELIQDNLIPPLKPDDISEETPSSPSENQSRKPDTEKGDKTRVLSQKHETHGKSKCSPENKDMVSLENSLPLNRTRETQEVRVKMSETDHLNLESREKTSLVQSNTSTQPDVTTSTLTEGKVIQSPPRVSGGWRASLSHGLIGRLGAAFVAAATGHNVVPQASAQHPNGTQQTNDARQAAGYRREPIREPIKPVCMTGSQSYPDPSEVHQKLKMNDMSESQDSSYSGIIYPTSSVSSHTQSPFHTVSSTTNEPNKTIRRSLQIGSVSRAVQEFESPISTDSDEPQSHDGRTGRALSVFAPFNVSERKTWDVQKPNRVSIPNRYQPDQPRRQHVGRLQELFESGAVSQSRRLFVQRTGQHHNPNPKPTVLLSKRN